MSLPQVALDQVLSLLASCSAHHESAQSQERDGLSKLTSFLQLDNGDSLVDSALGMLGFITSDHSLSSFLVRTLISVLSSTLSCESQLFLNRVETAAPLRCGLECGGNIGSNGESMSGHKDERYNPHKFYFGGSLAPRDLRKIVEYSLDFLKKAEIEKPLAVDLLEVLVNMVSFGSCLWYEREGQSEANQNPDAASSIIGLVVQFALERKEAFYNLFSPYIRLLLWRFQPKLVKQDLSSLLQRIAERPLLSLRHELRHGDGWRGLIVGMAFGPDIFAESRRLLNSWLLASGAPCMWDLKAEFGAAIQDVLENPCSWGLSVNSGADLPPLSAFYQYSLQSAIRILTRPPSWSGLRELVSLFDREVSLITGFLFLYEEEELILEASKNSLHPDNTSDYMEQANAHAFVLEESLWALLMEFPLWLQFASLSLFQLQCSTQQISGSQDNVDLRFGQSHLCNSRISEQEIVARYIAWLFSPHDQKHRDHVVRMLVQIVKSWFCIGRENCIAEQDTDKSPTVKRRKVMVRDCQKSGMPVDLLKTRGLEHAIQHSSNRDPQVPSSPCKEVVQAVEQWLLNFQSSRYYIDNLVSQGAVAGSCNRKSTGKGLQAKRRLLMQEDCTPMVRGERGLSDHLATQSLAISSLTRMSTFLDSIPLVALVSSPGLQRDAVVSVILSFIMSEGNSLTCERNENEGQRDEFPGVEHEGNIFQAGYFSQQALIFREPSHRTEDFKDLRFLSSCTTGVATLFKFLETLELLEGSEFVNGNCGLGWLGGFKEAIVKQLMVCIHYWSEQADFQHLALLDDLQRRASIWATQAGLETSTLRAFNQVLQGLDIIIASSLVDV